MGVSLIAYPDDYPPDTYWNDQNGEGKRCWPDDAYEMGPSFGIKFLRSCDWMPDRFTGENVYGDWSPQKMRAAAQAIRQNVNPRDIGRDRAGRFMDLAVWLEYWATQGVRVNG